MVVSFTIVTLTVAVWLVAASVRVTGIVVSALTTQIKLVDAFDVTVKSVNVDAPVGLRVTMFA